MCHKDFWCWSRSLYSQYIVKRGKRYNWNIKLIQSISYSSSKTKWQNCSLLFQSNPKPSPSSTENRQSTAASKSCHETDTSLLSPSLRTSALAGPDLQHWLDARLLVLTTLSTARCERLGRECRSWLDWQPILYTQGHKQLQCRQTMQDKTSLLSSSFLTEQSAAQGQTNITNETLQYTVPLKGTQMTKKYQFGLERCLGAPSGHYWSHWKKEVQMKKAIARLRIKLPSTNY